MQEPDSKTLGKMQAFVKKYREKSGTSAHPNAAVGEAVEKGLAANKELLGKPLCPCNFYEDKEKEVTSRRWLCPCDEMKQCKYCHCMLFVDPDGNPITEYLPEDHEGRQIYGIVKDPTPGKGREAKDRPPSPPPEGEE